MTERFSAILAPTPVATLLDQVRDRRAFIAALAPAATALLTWSDLLSLLQDNAVAPKHVMIRLHRQRVAEVLYVRRTPDREILDCVMIEQLADRGASVVVNNLQKYAPPVRELARSMARMLGVNRVQANYYATFGIDGAFKPHYDDHDVLAVQLAGAKTWRLYDTRVPERPGKQVAAGQLTAEKVLTSGHGYYVPAGVVHDTSTRDAPSIHVTLGFNWPPTQTRQPKADESDTKRHNMSIGLLVAPFSAYGP